MAEATDLSCDARSWAGGDSAFTSRTSLNSSSLPAGSVVRPRKAVAVPAVSAAGGRAQAERKREREPGNVIWWTDPNCGRVALLSAGALDRAALWAWTSELLNG